MTQLAATDTAGSLSDHRARQTVFARLREALAACDKWDDFVAHLEAHGLPEARVRQITNVAVPMDLHVHSSCSDGQVAPHKVPWLARVMGLKTVGLVDRDSISGTREFYGEAMLLGLAAVPGVELSTGIPGLDILVYFPDAGRFFDFLTSPRGRRFQQYLDARQEATHQETLKVAESVNRWLKRQGAPADRQIAERDLDAWFSGRRPYHPSALAYLAMDRLTPAQRESAAVRDARTMTRKVIDPAVKRIVGAVGKIDVRAAVDEVRRQLASVRRSRAASVAILAHPKDLMTKAKMSLGLVAKTLEYLAAKVGLDGVEVGGPADTAGDVRIWREIVDDLNGRIARREVTAAGPLLVSSYASEFRLLAPGEPVMGLGMLSERQESKMGNLRPQGTPEELLEAMRHRASLRTAEP
jgi:hypothetical protein